MCIFLPEVAHYCSGELLCHSGCLVPQIFWKGQSHLYPYQREYDSRGYRNDSLAVVKLNILNIWIHFLIYKDSSKESRPGKTLK